MTEIIPTGRMQLQHPEIAQAVGKSGQNSRHLAARARQHIEARSRGSRSTAEPGEELSELPARLRDRRCRFPQAAPRLRRSGLQRRRRQGHRSTPAGVRHRPHRPLHDELTRRRIQLGHSSERRVTVNGQPGLLVVEPDGRVSDVITIDIADGAIRGVLIVRNPDKLRHLHDHPLSTSGPML
jgi:RNA polymerase sigma-70 factor (ECF subfamily)